MNSTPGSYPLDTSAFLSPDGQRIWSIFERAYTSSIGHAPQDFRFVIGHTPMSTWPSMLSVLIAYYSIILGGREIMRAQKPVQLNFIFKMHNLGLSVLSGILLVLMVEQLVPMIRDHGLFHSICKRDGGWSDKLVVLYYLNYLTKYVELLDTCFLVLKKKPLTFLHTYHHGATVFLCFTQLVDETSVSWVPIALNLAVHVVMYFYYFQTARGIRVWWKQYITILQISQFVIDLGFIYFAFYTHYTHKFKLNLPNLGSCHAKTLLGPVTGAVTLSSYLVLFVVFYAATYKKGRTSRLTGLVDRVDSVQRSVVFGMQQSL